MQTEYSCAGIILNNGRVAVVYQKSTDSWALPKGHIDEGEQKENTARREIAEEIGIKDMEFVKNLGYYERPTRKSAYIKKHITVLLFRTDVQEFSYSDPENPKARWIDVDDVADVLTYEGDKEFFLKVRNQF